MSFIKEIKDSKNNVLEDWTALGTNGVLGLDTSAGFLILWPVAAQYMEGKIYNGCMDVSTVKPCCPFQSYLSEFGKQICPHCGETCVIESTITIIEDLPGWTKSYFIEASSFIDLLAPNLNADTFTSILWAQDLYNFVTEHFNPVVWPEGGPR